jgi:hypothetical protein
VDSRKKLIKQHNDFAETLNKKAEKHLIKLGFKKEWVKKSMNQLRKNQRMK